MNRRDLLLLGSASLLALGGSAQAAQRKPPNFVIVLCDDLGYGDVGAYGGRQIPTPNIDRMAAEGVLMTDYYAPQNLCTPSRAGLLTGRYPIRTGLAYEVIRADDTRGLDPSSEVTIARALKPKYATGLFGKWHLGNIAPYWPPTTHGFDKFFGIKYSHDMSPLAYYEADASGEKAPTAVDFRQLQQQFYAHAERFIEEHRDGPFFVELALSAPHLPEYPHAPYEGLTKSGPYGDVVAEIDDIVGRLFAKLKALGLDENTLVIFTSDNGPWFEGSSGALRDRKGGAGYDGGYRVPFIARLPGFLPAGVRRDALISGIDILPTFCAMAGVPSPAGVTLDGRDIIAVLRDGAPTPHDQIVLFDNESVAAIRTQKWKYVGSSYYRGVRVPLELIHLQELYDVSQDPGESYSVASYNPKVTEDMQRRLAAAQAEFAPLKHKDIPETYKRARAMLPPQD